MDGSTTGKPDGSGSHIWLHYTTQFTVGERTHTIEMDIPVPIGASADVRERLLREAEAAMYQLTSRVESREGHGQAGAQVRNPSPQQRTVPTPKALPPASSASSTPSATPTNKPAISPAVPASAPAASMPASLSTRDAPIVSPSESKELAVPPTRPNIGASMPSAPGSVGSISGNLSLPQFLQFIKENMGGMSARQAMDLLKVKTLSGLNLREALEQLQQIVGREFTSTTIPTMPTTPAIPSTGQKVDDVSPARPEAKSPPATSPSVASSSARPAPVTPPTAASSAPTELADPSNKNPSGIKELTHAVVRDMPPAYTAFDEEIDLDLDEEEEELVEYLPELTDQERSTAEHVLNKLKDARGSSSASEARIKVVHNVVDSQISEEQLQELIEGVWGVTTLKKLKNDQVEALISWAKEDDFVSELEMVLMLLQEDQYARSDR
jgi:hypothetical protein